MTNKRAVFLVCVIAGSATWGVSQSEFAIKESHPDSGGVSLKSAAGTMRVEFCGDRVVHVVASPSAEIPNPKVPVVVQPCRANDVQVKKDKDSFTLISPSLKVTVDAASGAI